MAAHKFGMQGIFAPLTFALCFFNVIISAQSYSSAEQLKITLYSEILKENREILINLPDDYNSSSKRYPVLIVLDAEDKRRYDLSMSGFTYFNGIRRLPKMIMAGIPNTNRTRDVAPYIIKQRKSSGGGEKFLNFITDELIPYIDSNYRIAEYKIFFGASSAGTFGLYALYTKPDIFNAVIASRPALNSTPEITWNNEIFFEKMNELMETQKCAGKSIYIDYGGQEDDYHEPSSIHRLSDLITYSAPQNFKTEFEKIEESNYRSAESMLNGLLWIFNDWYYPADSLYVNGFKGVENHANKLTGFYGYIIKPEDLLSENELNIFGNRFLEQGNVNEAIRLLNYAVNIYTSSWNAHDNLAEAYFKIGEIELVIEHLKKSLQLNPENNNAKELLKKFDM